MLEMNAESLGQTLGLSEEDTIKLRGYIAAYYEDRFYGRDNTSEPASNSSIRADEGVDGAAVNAALGTVLQEGLHEFAHNIVASLRRDMPQLLAERRANRAGFESRLYARWRSAIDLFEAIVVVAQESGADFNQKYRPQAAQDQDYVFEVLTRLHARACLLASEVLALLRSGYASGANARWRTLHEVAVVAYFIRQHGQDVAKRYLSHHVIESAKSAKEYQKYSERLNVEPFSDEELTRLQAEADELCQKFGASYRGRYGWAASILKGDPTFARIEEAVVMQHMRPYYGMASSSVHAKPHAIKFDLGNLNPHITMLAGPSNTGLADPGQGAAIALLQITTTLLALSPDVREVVNMLSLQSLVEESLEAFIAVHRQIMEEEEYAETLRATEIMTAEEFDSIRHRWLAMPHTSPRDRNGYRMAHAAADIQRLIAEVERLRG